MRHKVSFARRGQMLILFALLIPVIMLFVGLGLDIGWYYLNVSRLQNAADAAVVAGAHALVDDINAKNAAAKNLVTYSYDGTITDKYSANISRMPTRALATRLRQITR